MLEQEKEQEHFVKKARQSFKQSINTKIYLSSINLQKVSTHSFKHNDRSEEIPAKTINQKYSHLNEYGISAKEAKDNFESLYNERLKNNTSKRKPAKQNTLWEAVVNIKPDTTITELKQLQKHIEQQFNFTGLQIAIHRDEGHPISDGSFKVNHHAHLSFFTLNKEGRQMFRREHINQKKLRDLQSDTAKILSMQRGVDKRESKRSRLEHKEYKIAIQAYTKQKEQYKAKLSEQNTQIAKLKDLKELNNQLREKLKQDSARREDYARVEQFFKDLKEQIKSKDLTVEHLKQKYNDLQRDFTEHKEQSQNEINLRDNKILELVGNNQELTKQVKNLQNKNMLLNQQGELKNISDNKTLRVHIENLLKLSTEPLKKKIGLFKTQELTILKDPKLFLDKTMQALNTAFEAMYKQYKRQQDRDRSIAERESIKLNTDIKLEKQDRIDKQSNKAIINLEIAKLKSKFQTDKNTNQDNLISNLQKSNQELQDQNNTLSNELQELKNKNSSSDKAKTIQEQIQPNKSQFKANIQIAKSAKEIYNQILTDIKNSNTPKFKSVEIDKNNLQVKVDQKSIKFNCINELSIILTAVKLSQDNKTNFDNNLTTAKRAYTEIALNKLQDINQIKAKTTEDIKIANVLIIKIKRVNVANEFQKNILNQIEKNININNQKNKSNDFSR